ncbi:MAG: calcium-binding protein, partial [Planctomycetota bacterium]
SQAHSPLPAATVESLGKGAYPVALLAGETVSSYTAALSGFAAESSANPLASSIGVTNPANVLSVSIPAAAGVVQALGTQWEAYNATAKSWDTIAGASSATFTPSAANGLPQGATIRAMSEFIDANGSLKLIYSNASAPLGRQVVGTVGDNVLVGTAFQDVIYGGDGNDSLNGLAGSDYLAGGRGNDAYVVDTATDTVVEQVSEGTDTVSSSVTYTLGANVENLTLTGNGNINATGNDFGNVLTGNAGNNQLTGGGLDDILLGGGGNDVLIGGLGADTLTGGAGNNTYRYTSLTQSLTTALDVITSFVIGGGDTFDAPIAVASGSIRKVAVAGAYSATSLQNQFTTSNFVTNGAAALVTFANSTTEAYLVINNSVAGFDRTTDLVVKIRYTGRLGNFTIV